MFGEAIRCPSPTFDDALGDTEITIRKDTPYCVQFVFIIVGEFEIKTARKLGLGTGPCYGLNCKYTSLRDHAAGMVIPYCVFVISLVVTLTSVMFN